MLILFIKKGPPALQPRLRHGPGERRGQPGSPFPTSTLSSHIWLRPAQVVGIPRPRGGWWRDLGGEHQSQASQNSEWQGSKSCPPALQTVMVQGCSRPGQLKTKHGGLGPGLLGPTPCVLCLSSVTWAGATLKGQEEPGVWPARPSLLAPSEDPGAGWLRPQPRCCSSPSVPLLPGGPSRREDWLQGSWSMGRGGGRQAASAGNTTNKPLWEHKAAYRSYPSACPAWGPAGELGPAPHWRQGKLRHSTGTHRCDHTLLVKKEMAFTSVQSALNNICIFIKFP